MPVLKAASVNEAAGASSVSTCCRDVPSAAGNEGSRLALDDLGSDSGGLFLIVLSLYIGLNGLFKLCAGLCRLWSRSCLGGGSYTE